MEQEGRLCDEVETLREFTYLDDRISADGRQEADCQTKVWKG